MAYVTHKYTLPFFSSQKNQNYINKIISNGDGEICDTDFKPLH